MELSLAVTHSLTDLIRRCKVYCTEPFRIPLAGMVTTCCFDTTGTRTSDDMRFLGVVLRENMDELPIRRIPLSCADKTGPCIGSSEVQNVAVACHS
jgi:magnesium-transporting ATPase (P-type)